MKTIKKNKVVVGESLTFTPSNVVSRMAQAKKAGVKLEGLPLFTYVAMHIFLKGNEWPKGWETPEERRAKYEEGKEELARIGALLKEVEKKKEAREAKIKTKTAKTAKPAKPVRVRKSRKPRPGGVGSGLSQYTTGLGKTAKKKAKVAAAKAEIAKTEVENRRMAANVDRFMKNQIAVGANNSSFYDDGPWTLPRVRDFIKRREQETGRPFFAQPV